MFSKNIFSCGKNYSKFINTGINKFKNCSISSFSKYSFSTSVSTERTYGGLKDQDRIFTNLYKDDDPFIDGALRRVY